MTTFHQPTLYGREPVRIKPNWLTRNLARVDVVDPITFAQYAQQTIGTPLPKGKDVIALRKVLKDFFEENPQIDYALLARLVDWCRSRKKRPASALAVPGYLRYAWAAGHFPELDPNNKDRDDDLERAIDRALEDETNPEWRRRLVGAQGNEARKGVLAAWRRMHR